MIWDEFFIGRMVSFSEIQKGISQVWKIPEEQIRVFTRQEFERLVLNGETISEPIRCEIGSLQGGFPIQLECFWVGDDVRPPESLYEALRALASLWECSIITSHETDPGDLFYLVDEHGRTPIWVNLDWLEEHNEVIYKIATDEAQSDE